MYAVNMSDVHLGIVVDKVAPIGGYVYLTEDESNSESVKLLVRLNKIKLVEHPNEANDAPKPKKVEIEIPEPIKGSTTPPKKKEIKKASNNSVAEQAKALPPE